MSKDGHWHPTNGIAFFRWVLNFQNRFASLLSPFISANTMNMLSNFMRFTSCFHYGWRNNPPNSFNTSEKAFSSSTTNFFPVASLYYLRYRKPSQLKIVFTLSKNRTLPKINRSNVNVKNGFPNKHTAEGR